MNRPWSVNGPWSVGVNRVDSITIRGADGRPVAEMWWTSGANPDKRRDEMHAHARLIAAAPEMYEALRGALDALSMLGSIPGGPSDTARRLIRGALAKVEGQAP